MIEDFIFICVCQALKNDVTEIRKSSNIIQNSLSIIEIIMCTCDQLRSSSTEIPTQNATPRDAIIVAGATIGDSSWNEADYTQKRKMAESEHDGGRIKSVVDVSDSEEDTTFLNQTSSFANLKMESPSVVGKSQVPSIWTQPREGSSKKNKTCQTPMSQSSFKNKGASPVITLVLYLVYI